MRHFTKYPSSYVKAGRDNRHYSDYFGAAARDDIGKNLSNMFHGWVISKRRCDGDKEYGLKGVADAYRNRGLPYNPDNFDPGEDLDMWYILEALEGMCYNNEACEVDDGYYYIGSYAEWKKDQAAHDRLAEIYT